MIQILKSCDDIQLKEQMDIITLVIKETDLEDRVLRKEYTFPRKGGAGYESAFRHGKFSKSFIAAAARRIAVAEYNEELYTKAVAFQRLVARIHSIAIEMETGALMSYRADEMARYAADAASLYSDDLAATMYLIQSVKETLRTF